VSEPELKLASQLIEQLAAKRFNPNDHVDEHRARVQAAIQRKVEGKEVSIAEAPSFSGGSNVVDLMDALKASLKARGSRAAEMKRKAPKKAPAPGVSPKKSSRR
jgi:DNA end-binding protein Ku